MRSRAELGLKYKDLMVLEHLVEAGADMTAPRHVIHYLYFRSQAEARAAGRTVEAQEFAVEVRSPDEGMTGWAVVCELHGCVLTNDAVRDNTDFFEALAESFHGDYDGWEASVS